MTPMNPLSLALLLAGGARAQDALELGVIRNEDVHVVQKIAYPKEDRTELGAHVGIMPFDAFLTTPNAQLSFNRHLSESMSISAVVGGGYSFKTLVAKDLETPTYGVVAYEYRYLGSALAGVEYAPIYAKMNVNGARVYHFDVYGALRGGATVGQSILPDHAIGVGPTLSPGVGTRVFLGRNSALRVELRDDLLLERRSIVEVWKFKQNANLTVGLTVLSRTEDG